jgi:ribonuclease E
MPKQIIIAEQHRIGAVFWEDQIQELVVATGQHQVGDIHLGLVENILPGIDAAFVNIGDTADRNGFIHVSDLGPLRLRRSSGAITELLAPHQKVLVQILKEPTGNKGPRLTGNISLPGRYVVLMPFGRGVNLSRRIRSESERNRLRAVAILSKPRGMGLLVRTEAEGTSEDALLEDLDRLLKQWEIVQEEANTTRAPALLNRDDDFIQRVLRDMYSNDVNRIAIDSAQGVKRIKQFLVGWNNGTVPNNVSIDRHQERLPLLEYFRVNGAIREALKPRVDLPSGGYIIIEPTEALTVIDVNSGSFTQSRNSRETVLWTNCEAATEIARQLRLRNIAGVIVVDFIDMEYRKDQIHVLEHFTKQLRADKATPQISQLSELGLVELTRKRQGQNIYELFGRPCPSCGGLGHLAHLPDDENSGESVGVSLASTTSASRESSSRFYRSSSDRLGSDYRPSDNWDEYEGKSDRPLNLVHHPDYQERNNLGKKQRRRRLGRGAERDESMRSNSPSPSRQFNNGDRPHHDRWQNDRSVPETAAAAYVPNTPQPSQVEAFGTDDEILELEQQEPKAERERPAKPQRTKPTRPVLEPPEVVAIEMSDLEKETYAWMGISPTIKLERELKNPKTAIINIVPPGSLPPNTDPIQTEVTISATDSGELEFAIPVVPSAIDSLPEPESTTAPAIEIETPPPSIAAVDTQLEPIATESTSEEEEDENPSNRRRRRRSSATAD